MGCITISIGCLIPILYSLITKSQEYLGHIFLFFEVLAASIGFVANKIILTKGLLTATQLIFYNCILATITAIVYYLIWCAATHQVPIVILFLFVILNYLELAQN